MSVLPPLSVRIVTDSPQQEAAWTDALLSADAQIVGESESADVILTSLPGVPSRPGETFVARDGVGLVAVGPSAEADVALDPDATSREIVLACRLVGEIVRLRRQQHDGYERSAKLRALAYTDALTGVANRRAWDEELPCRVQQAAGQHTADALVPERGTLCLALFDIDHFKHVNDTAGHPVGDRVLQLIGRALTASVRACDFVARIGGDEFAVLLVDLPTERGFEVVERIRTQVVEAMQPVLPLAQDPADHDASTLRLTVSAGFAWLSDVGPTGEAAALFASADAALRAAKLQGRDRTVAGR